VHFPSHQRRCGFQTSSPRTGSVIRFGRMVTRNTRAAERPRSPAAAANAMLNLEKP
jgi:hypothetical protein